MESSSLVELFSTIYYQINHNKNISILVNNHILFSYTFSAHSVSMNHQESASTLHRESSVHSDITCQACATNPQNTSLITIKSFRPYMSFLIAPSFSTLCYSSQLYSQPKFRQLLTYLTPLVSFEYVSEILSISMNDIYYWCYIILQSGYAELIYPVDNDSRFVVCFCLCFYP